MRRAGGLLVDTWRRNDIALYALAALTSTLIAVVALELWNADFSVPLTYAGDALPVGAHFKTVIEQGWYEYQPDLGAPYGQTYNDFPTADNLHLIVAKVIALFTGNWAIAMNSYYLLGFPLIALAAVWFLRTLGISRMLSLALAVVYAIAPYHFVRGESHMWLASYYGIPLGLGLIALVLLRKPLWARGTSSNRVLAVIVSPSARTVLFLAILATSSSYYAVFFLILIAFAGIGVLVRDRDWRLFWGAATAGGVTVVVMLANMLPDMLYSWQNGQNPSGLERSGGESEFYAFKLAQLLLPWSGHRIAILRELRQKYDQGYVALGEQPALGAIAAAGLLAALVVVFAVVFLRRGAALDGLAKRRVELLGGLSALVLVAFLFATMGGFSTLISVLTTSLRGWNRMSIVIAMLSLGILGLLIDWLVKERIAAKLGTALKATVSVVLAFALVTVAFIDQTPYDSSALYDTYAKAYAADESYINEIEDILPDDAEVLVLPSVPFPESSSPTGLLASTQLIPYLHSETLRWSNGGIKGRPRSDWTAQVDDYSLANVAALGATAGFSGILVDRPGLLDHGVALEAALTESVGTSPLESADGRYAFYDIRALSSALESDVSESTIDEMEALITNPVVLYPQPDFTASVTEELDSAFITKAPVGTVTLTNANDTTRTVTLSFLVTRPGTPGSAIVTLADGTEIVGTTTDDGEQFTIDLDAAPGNITFAVTWVSDQPTNDLLTISAITMVEHSVDRYLESVGP